MVLTCNLFWVLTFCFQAPFFIYDTSFSQQFPPIFLQHESGAVYLPSPQTLGSINTVTSSLFQRMCQKPETRLQCWLAVFWSPSKLEPQSENWGSCSKCPEQHNVLLTQKTMYFYSQTYVWWGTQASLRAKSKNLSPSEFTSSRHAVGKQWHLYRHKASFSGNTGQASGALLPRAGIQFLGLNVALALTDYDFKTSFH